MTLYEVIQKLIGPIDPIGDAHVDSVRLANLDQAIEVVDRLLSDITKVSHDACNPAASISRAGKTAKKFLATIEPGCADQDSLRERLDELICCTTSWYLGRQTIAVAAWCETIAARWNSLSEPTQDYIRRIVEERFRRDEIMSHNCRPGAVPLGQLPERDAWELVRRCWAG